MRNLPLVKPVDGTHFSLPSNQGVVLAQRASDACKLRTKLGLVLRCNLLSPFAALVLQVAIMCNHQRSVPQAHGSQKEKLVAKLEKLESELQELEKQKKVGEGHARLGRLLTLL